MSINGQDALTWHPAPDPKAKRKKAPHASYTRRFEEIEAYTAMGLKPQEYDALPGTPYWARGGLSKCDVVIWYRYHCALDNLRTGIF